MKTILFTNRKGGVGKSAIACQMAHYLEKNSYRVLVLDFDHQCDASRALISKHSCFLNADVSAIDLFSKEKTQLKNISASMLVAGSDDLKKIEREVSQHNNYINNLKAFLDHHSNDFDFCLIDSNPSPDIRQIAGMCIADYVISPIQLNQEAVNGIGMILKQIKTYKQINSKLEFLGILPNFVEKTPFQQENLSLIKQHYPKILIETKNDYAFIPKASAIAEAQALGGACNKLKKTQGYETQKVLTHVFSSIVEKILQ